MDMVTKLRRKHLKPDNPHALRGEHRPEPQKSDWSPKIPMKVERREISKLVTTYRRHSL